ncbi:cation:proton antiporter [Nitratiruptor sp. YY08-26]|uniref:cation:proton antiporter n=1 Tax=unclassified Nitratiruptor TaxID=2624044 RepID=UPI00191664CF|nr:MULTISPECIES: cation:proton antiporter [unclassified Nitratiruptor]BCD62985.1 cation:proton antiporter [Nitratiruptor sp. YY08-13]BCD66920.1 cation:proton antiporter [Nitratiruptor sp. YY08-26]
MNEIAIITTISLIIFSSPFLAKFTKLPTSVIEIALGTLFGTWGFLHHVPLFELVAEFGFLYLMFLAGLEVDLKKILAIDKKTLKKGFLYIGALYLLSFLLVKNLRFENIFIAIFPLISVGLIAALRKEYGKNYTWLNLSIAIGSLGEVVSIAILTIISTGLEFGFGTEFYKKIFILSLFLLLVLGAFKLLQVLFWWYPEIKTTLMPKIDNEEQDIRLSMALFFLFISLMLYLHLEVAFGAFIAGIFIATFFEHKRSLPHKLSSFGFGFLVPIFFIYTGSSFKIVSLLVSDISYSALLIAAIMICIRIIAAFVFYDIMKLKEQILFALSHSMPLTLLVAIATIALHTKFIDESEYMAFILASIIEVLFTMITIRLIIRFSGNISR